MTNSQKALPFKLGDKLERSFLIKRDAINVDARTVELAFSSEALVERGWGIEILDHNPSSIDLTRFNSHANLLCDHDPRDVVGVIESVAIGLDRIARAMIRFGKSERAEEVFQDVIDGIRKNVSVGYFINDAVLESVDDKDGSSTVRITSWTPFEISLVSVPADFKVGVGRSAEDIATDQPQPNPVKQEIRIMETVIEKPVDLDKIRSDARSDEQKRASEIIAIGTQFANYPGVDKLTQECVRSGEPIGDYRGKVMALIASQPAATPDIGLNAKETKQYSVLSAIKALADGDWSRSGFEKECHDAVLKRSGLSESPHKGFYVPYEVQKRDLTAGTPANGGYLVATDNLASNFIDLLRNRSVVTRMGATMLTGLVGNVTIPKQTGAGTAVWLANEATAGTESQPVIGQLPLTPKNVMAYTEISRQLMLQSSPSADSIVMNDLAQVIALGIDVAALSGSGASGQPLGITGTAGIGSVTGTTLGYAGIVEFQTDVAQANALALSSGYVTTPTVAGLLKQRQRFASTDTPIWTGNILDGEIEGFKAMSTMQMSAGSMIFGDWSQVVIGEWGMLEIALNQYANFTAAITGIRAIQTCDIGVRIPGAFSLATSIT
ncbi:MAG: phage major capsid protein [Methylotenera sp.]